MISTTSPANGQKRSLTAFTASNATVYASFDYASWGGSGADGIAFFLFDGSVSFDLGADGGSLGYAQKTLEIAQGDHKASAIVGRIGPAMGNSVAGASTGSSRGEFELLAELRAIAAAKGPP